MSSLIIFGISVILLAIIIFVTLYLFGFFSNSYSDLSPLKDLDYAIEPSLKSQVKEHYNTILTTIFSVLNKQIATSEPTDVNILTANINKELNTVLVNLQQNYTDEVKSKLMKYVLCKNIIEILDNYYLGPPINIDIPDIPSYYIKGFNFTYEAKRVKGTIPVKGSTLSPFKYLVHNIPVNIRDNVTILYDHLLRKYMKILNSLVSKLTIINMQTLYSINWNEFIQKNIVEIQEDLLKIQRILGSNIADLIKSILMVNVLPILNKFYTGPSINFVIPINIPSTPQVVTINFPNMNPENIFTIEQGCLKGEMIQTVHTGAFGYINQCVPKK
jgi:hypothetical protein